MSGLTDVTIQEPGPKRAHVWCPANFTWYSRWLIVLQDFLEGSNKQRQDGSRAKFAGIRLKQWRVRHCYAPGDEGLQSTNSAKNTSHLTLAVGNLLPPVPRSTGTIHEWDMLCEVLVLLGNLWTGFRLSWKLCILSRQHRTGVSSLLG